MLASTTVNNNYLNIKKIQADNDTIINGMQIKNNNTLSILVTYFGGCKEHSFKLFGFRETKNKVILSLEHNSNGDTCKK